MSVSDRLPDYPVNSDFVKKLKAALEGRDEARLKDLICADVRHVDAVIELANDDWMKDPSAQLPPGVLVGDLEHLKPLMDKFFQDANVVFEIKKDEMVWQVKSPATFGLSGLWTLEYKRELTTPLCIAAAQGDLDSRPCHLRTNSPGEKGDGSKGPEPAGRACGAGATGCAQALLEHGASVQLEGGTSRDTPLHVAAQRGLDEHARLYLNRGARVDARNGHGETALSAACGAALRPDEHARCLRLCTLLLRHGAAADTRDEDERSPLHKACGHARPGLARLLLLHGADARALDYGGASPLARVLQTAACAPEGEPQLTVQELLNHGSPTVWPDAFPKVLKSCAAVPTVIEVLFNSYSQLRVSESWKDVIPEEVFQMHQAFYRSLFALAHTPRCLQHLCRCAIRKSFGRKCFSLVPLLPLPESLQNYLLLEPEGVLH
nr:PREDICTED: ankyrin repeat and SOCS box protein 18 [Bos mutus]